jgi:predicted Zn-dependent protease
MAPRQQCDFALILTESDQINAFFDHRKVCVTNGLARFVADDSELAAVISHVVGHAMLGHVGEKSLTQELGEQLEALRRATLDQEDADRLALELMARAGEPLDALAAVWRRLGAVASGAVLLRDFHPVTPERLEAIDDLVGLAPGTKTAGLVPQRPRATLPQ